MVGTPRCVRAAADGCLLVVLDMGTGLRRLSTAIYPSLDLLLDVLINRATRGFATFYEAIEFSR